MDGGFVKFAQIEQAEQAGVKVCASPQQSRQDPDPHRTRDPDSVEIAAWRIRMATEEAKAIYRQRASTSDTGNADARIIEGWVRSWCVVRARSAAWRCGLRWRTT